MQVGESFYNEYIPPVVAHLDEMRQVVHDESGAKLIFPPGTKQEQLKPGFHLRTALALPHLASPQSEFSPFVLT